MADTPKVGLTTQVACGESYQPHRKHRGRPTKTASVWTKSVASEVGYFTQACLAGWGVGDCLWGHHASTHGLEAVGRNHFGEDLWFGKFVRSGTGDVWHGYPADYRRHAHDRPSTNVLVAWRRSGVLKKHQIAKVAGGRPCKL